jgi:hypothetical protein
MKKLLLLVLFGVMSIVFAVNAGAWCIEEVKVIKDCPKKLYVVTDLVVKDHQVGFCIDVNQAVSLMDWFDIFKVEHLVGQCHDEKIKWTKEPLIVKIIDEYVLLLSKPQKKDCKSI